MAENKLIWIGLVCCLAALVMQVFPEAAFQIGVDVGASWLVFGFGFLLIIMSLVVSLQIGRRRKDENL